MKKRYRRLKPDLVDSLTDGLWRPMGIEAADWQVRMESLISRGGGSLAALSERKKEDYFNYKKKFDEITVELTNAKEKEDALRKEIGDLTEQLASFDQKISVKELLVLQAIYVDLEERIESLENTIDLEAQKNDEAEHGEDSPLSSLMEEKENLLADIASGIQGDPEKLKSLEQQIAREEDLHEKQVEAIIATSQTIAGLNRKKEQTEMKLSIARQNFHDGLVNYLDQDIERAGKDYTAIAGQVSDLFMRIISLSTLRNKFGSQINILGSYTTNIQIPSFALDVCRSKECGDMPGILFRYWDTDPQVALDGELERLSKLGIKVS